MSAPAPNALVAALDGGRLDPDTALDRFIGWIQSTGVELYPHQEEAVLELFAGRHVLLKTPTGSGKSLVAMALQFRELAVGGRSVYTAPIKALVNEKFLQLSEALGPTNVGMMTGDGTVNRDAPVLCCTAEVLAKIALRHGEEAPFTAVVMDEFHYYGDRDRGMAWQIPLLTLPQCRFLLMSATLGDTTAIEKDLAARTGVEVAVVQSDARPVPLTFEYSRTPQDAKLAHLVRSGRAPIYAVHFTQRAAAELAQSLLSTDLCLPEEKAALKDAMADVRFDSPYGPTLRRFLLHGVGLHHAGLLPRYRQIVEKISQKGMFRVICGTDTLGVGINVPIRSVLFTQLCKYDGETVDILSVRDFKQIAGRAGRKGFDTEGLVVAQAPDWVIENDRLNDAIATGKKKKSKIVKKKPPTRGYKHWDEETFDRLVSRPPEPLESRFRVDHGLVLSLLQKADATLGDGMEELRQLIHTSHEGERAKVRLWDEAQQRLAELIGAGVVVDHGEDAVPRWIVQTTLQDDFSLHHALSLFLLHLVGQLDPAAPDYALDVITMVESILEHPRAALSAQVNRAKGELIAELKAAGVEYEDRMDKLESVTWPKPRGEWIYATYNAWKVTHPWLGDDAIRPKSVAREMYETQAVFSAYIKGLGLERAEGELLRYVSQVHRTLAQNVPEELRTPELEDVLAFFRAMLARVDDSLVRSWEAMVAGAPEEGPPPAIDISADPKAFRARVRAECHALVRALAAWDWEEAASMVHHDEEAWTAEDFERALAPYLEERGRLVFDARVKLGWTTQFENPARHLWKIRQILVDAEEQDDAWAIEAEVDLRADTNPDGPLLRVRAIGP